MEDEIEMTFGLCRLTKFGPPNGGREWNFEIQITKNSNWTSLAVAYLRSRVHPFDSYQLCDMRIAASHIISIFI